MTGDISEEEEVVVIEHSVRGAAEHYLCGTVHGVSTSVCNRNYFWCLTDDGG